MRLLLANVLGNAVRHGAEGRITVRWTEGALVVANPCRSTGTTDPGSGIGLSLVTAVARVHGASVEAAQQADRYVVTIRWRA